MTGFLIASWICSLIVQGVTIWSVGIQARGVHGWEMPIERFVQFKFSVYIGGSVFMPCASFAKIALLVFYLRLSPQTWFKYACWATLGIITVYTPAIFLALLFACRPLEASWRVELEGDCIDNTALFIATCVVNSFTDVVLFLLPIPSQSLRRLLTPRTSTDFRNSCSGLKNATSPKARRSRCFCYWPNVRFLPAQAALDADKM